MAYNSKSTLASEFIDDTEIQETLHFAEEKKEDIAYIQSLLEKAEQFHGLTHQEAAVLIQVENPAILEQIYAIARKVKEHIYGRRIVMFAPLYLSDYCVNECRYCAYHQSSCMKRKRLTQEEIVREIELLESMGHKRLALETGEDPINCPLEYVLESIKTIYSVKNKNGCIRRVNVNIAATTVENYRKLKEAGIGTYILFQETYHRPTYEKMHIKGPKHNYEYHTTAHDRAMKGGIDDVGIGVLFGLYNWKYEFVASLLEVKHLEDTFGVGPHTISVPRVRKAANVDESIFSDAVADEDFKKIVAVYRLAVPYTGIIISTREDALFRDEVLALGVSQLSAGSCTGVGGYAAELEENGTDAQKPQFEVADHRTPMEVLQHLMDTGYIPSFCTACYREGRTGDRFMKLAKTGQISNTCQPNALLTLQEYAMDYGTESFQQSAQRLITAELEKIPNPTVREKTKEYLQAMTQGQRDFRF